MSSVIVLDGIELIPVLELMPITFAAQARSSPSGTPLDVPDQWDQYWLDSLADSGITGLTPLQGGSWHVPTAEFVDQTILQKLLVAIFDEWGGIEALSDPDGKPVLNGGLAVRCPTADVLIEPGCCADLGDVANWMEAANYRQTDWHPLWIGHPWLSVRFEEPWLIISDLHESDNPTARWAVSPDGFQRAVVAAKAELDRFARQIATALPILGYQGDNHLMGQKLAGLDP
jgi:hypothetical protein